MLTLGSLFDGIGGWPLAAVKYGVEPLWASEIEKFPIEVTKYYFSKMKHLGDIREVNGAEIEPVDILCFGFPCTSVSVAGKREGFAGESGLFYEAIRILREMREATNGECPKYAVVENVTGLLNHNRGLTFRTVLEEIAETNIPMPKSGRWANAGMVRSNQCEIAWRVLDAQYWGVPQRRKRIFLVADFGKECAGEILFKSEGLCRNLEKSERERKGITPAVETSTDDTGRLEVYDMTHADEVIRVVTGGKTQTLNARMGTGGNQVLIVFKPGIANRDKSCVQTFSLQGSMIGRETKNGPQGSGINENVSFTLNTVDRHAVCIGNGQLHQMGLSNKVGALNTMHDQQCVMYSVGSFAQYRETQTATTLKASGGDLGGGSENLVAQKTIRRLTPLECERLQGLPDGYTLIDDKSCSDSARYKALGNGMAQPCADFVIGSIVLSEENKL